MRIHHAVVNTLAIVVGAVAGVPAAAQEVHGALQVTQDAVGSAASKSKATAPETRHALFGTPLDSERLTNQRGGQDLIINDQKLKATVTDNVASNLTTGNNVITEGAFAGANGLPMVIQNSGNNVSIQNTTILNLNMK
ncbi:MAG TPA: hypothetical protein VK663_03960 [Burkholderiales bacterium]|nr:hypothetical protein [Burkholderiales bacterium]